MNALWSSISENVQFVLLCLGVTAAVVLLAWGSEKLVMKKRHRLNTAHTITTVGMLAAISGVLMVIELPLFFAPPFYKLDFSELQGLGFTECRKRLRDGLLRIVRTLQRLPRRGKHGVAHMQLDRLIGTGI